MALQVLVAHTGQRLSADPGSFASLDAFKAWVAKYSHIAVRDQISLTAHGKAVKQQTLFTEKEIFVFHPNFLGSPHTPLPPKYALQRPPDTLSDTQDLQSWVELFKARRAWSLRLLEDVQEMANTTQEKYLQVDVMSRSFDAAVVNLETHVKTLRNDHSRAQAWVRDLVDLDLGNDAEAVLNQLRSIPSAPSLIQFVTGHDSKKQKATLEDLVDHSRFKEAGTNAGGALNKLKDDSAALDEAVDQFMQNFEALLDRVEKGAAKSALEKADESKQLMEDIEALVKKVNADYENVLDLPVGQKSLSQASKSALLHTTKHLPTLTKRAYEMESLLRYAAEMRNQAASELIQNIQTVTILTGDLGRVNQQLNLLELPHENESAVEYLSTTQQLPITYASFLAEAIRRREWNEKVRADSSTLVNEMAIFQDEEERRRKKWHKSVGALFWPNKVDSKTIGLEVNILGEEEAWPQVSRQQLEDVLTSLKTQGSKPEIVDGVSQIIHSLDNPTKQQTKRAKAFKAGSLHEAALGKSALLMRGDDELIRSLQDEIARTTSKLKGSESRVRRLEDLVHRQGVNRLSIGHTFQLNSVQSPDSTNPLTSPKLNDHSRQSSISSRRYSSNQSPEDKALAQKLISLEAELMAERENSAGLNKELAARASATNEIKAQMDDANHTKKDLMGNLEAQKREFMEERRSLEDEMKRMNAKIEELDDELDRVLGSRDKDRANGDDRVRSLLEEVERLRKETEKAQGQVEFLRDDARAQNEAKTSLERQLRQAIEEKKSATTRAERAEANVFNTLHEIHSQLSPQAEAPKDTEALANSAIRRAKHITDELEARGRDLTMVRSDLNAAQAHIVHLREQISMATERLGAEEMETFQLRETLGAEKARFNALNEELADERAQLLSLREKFASGETGSEALKDRVAEGEQKVTGMSEELAAKQSQVKSLEQELKNFQESVQKAHGDLHMLQSRFDARSICAADLSQRLYAQNERMTSLLERFRYSVTRQGDSMIVQKIPRTDRTSANDSSDPSASIRRSISGADTLKRAMLDSTDLELLHWTQSEDPQIESEKYQAFLDTLGQFDIEAFDAAVSKQLTSVEHTAKKYRRDARAYREKAHSAQKEAHEKIALKNFKEGDLALFLPTRGQSSGAWAAFNVGAPHYFLREQDSHKLRNRDWLLARIQKIEDRVVDLSKSMNSLQVNAGDGRSIGEASTGSYEDDNPFDLSDGLRWHLIEAVEEKPGAPTTPGQGKSTVASAKIDATGSITKEAPNSMRRTIISSSSKSTIEGVISKTLTRSLDSRRSSSDSKKAPLPSSLFSQTQSQAGGGGGGSKATSLNLKLESVSPDNASAADEGGCNNNNNTGNGGTARIDGLLGP